MGTPYIRAAAEADQAAIRRIVREAGINPMGLHWQNFLVAEDGRELVAIGQIKPHSDGSRELASIAVVPERRGQGLADAVIGELLRRERGELYLYCRNELGSFYARFGFATVRGDDLPPSLRRIFRFGEAVTSAIARLTGSPVRLLAMRRPPMPEES